ncbi:hypothetical protein KKH23_10945 [Patescibacteria group bacterium]|nr:hypothetical protein [Patescibacteria group bacterium]
MNILTKLLESPMALNLALSSLVAVWAWIKASDWWQARVTGKKAEALECLELGAEKAYEAYVRGIQAGREDGTLTDDERAEARQLAIDAAVRYGKERGLDLLALLGSTAVDAMIGLVVNKAKRAAAEARAAKRAERHPYLNDFSEWAAMAKKTLAEKDAVG